MRNYSKSTLSVFLFDSGVVFIEIIVYGSGFVGREVLKRLEPFHPPQKYQNEYDPILMLELVLGHFGSSTFKVDRWFVFY